MAKKLDFLPDKDAGNNEEGPDPTQIFTKDQAKTLAPETTNLSGERDPAVILSRVATQPQRPSPLQQRSGQVPQQQKQGNYWEVDWGTAAEVLYTQGNALKGMDNDAAKVSAAVILSIADALVVGIRSAASKRGAR